MKTFYVEGTGILHRLPANAKLGGLALFAVAVFFTRSPVILGVAVILPLAAYLSLDQSVRQALRPLRPIVLTIVIVGLFHLLLTSAEEAIVTVLRLSALMFLAATVTATTRIGDVIDTVSALARPLERLGLLRASDIGLAVGLVIRFVPEILARYAAIRDAHTARGLSVRPATLIAPLIVATLKDADNIADAIDARGIRRQ